jgi:hypothetical protein
MYWYFTGDWPRDVRGAHYDGWATVERSTPSELVLFARPMAGDDDAGVDDAPSAAHSRIAAQNDLPIITPGSRLWLTFFTDDDFGGIPRRRGGTQLSLRDAANGALLLSHLSLPGTLQDDLTADALTFRAPSERCSRPAECMHDGGRVISYSLEAQADVSVRLNEGEHTRIALAGEASELWLNAAFRRTGTKRCSDAPLDDRLWVAADVRSLEPEHIISQLPRGDLPACKLGNDPSLWIDHGVGEHGISETIEREVRYRGRYETQLVFDLVGDVGYLSISESASLAEPAVGQSFWLSSTYWYFVLRESETGPVVLASGSFSDIGGMVDEASVTLIGQWLGTALAVEADCVYERIAGNPNRPTGPSYLFRARFGEAPGFIVTSGTSKRIEIAGLAYDATITTEDTFIPLTITRARK